MRFDEDLDVTAPAAQASAVWDGVMEATGSFRGDLGVEDGASHSGHESDDVFLGCGDGAFARVSALSGFHHDGDGRSLARWDLDRDGRVDLALASANRPLLQVFRNQVEPAGGVLAVRLHGGATPGSRGLSNRDAVGAVVEARVGERRIVRELRRGEGFAAQSSATLLIGLGDASRVDELEVRWPSGKRRVLRGLTEGELVELWEVRSQAPTRLGWTREPYRRAVPTPVTVVAAEARFPWAVEQDGPTLFTSMATWCAACRSEVPWFAGAAERFPELGLVALPVEPEDGPEELAAWMEELSPAYSLRPVEDRESLRAWLAEAVGREAVPSSVLVDGAGRVLWSGPGVPSRSELRRALARPVR